MRTNEAEPDSSLNAIILRAALYLSFFRSLWCDSQFWSLHGSSKEKAVLEGSRPGHQRTTEIRNLHFIAFSYILSEEC